MGKLLIGVFMVLAWPMAAGACASLPGGPEGADLRALCAAQILAEDARVEAQLVRLGFQPTEPARGVADLAGKTLAELRALRMQQYPPLRGE